MEKGEVPRIDWIIHHFTPWDGGCQRLEFDQKSVEPSTKMVDGSTIFWYHSIRDFTPAGLPQTFH
jgi:hypothetical protein